MSAREYLEEAIREADGTRERLEDQYWSLPPGEREHAIWAQDMEEKIENLRDAIDHMRAALEILPEE